MNAAFSNDTPVISPAVSDEALIAEIERRRPDLVVAPRQATLIMAMRGAQEDNVFEEGDAVSTWVDLSDAPDVPGFPVARFSGDEREWLLAAAVWRGCVRGLDEWRRRQAETGDDPFIQSWLKPCVRNAAAMPDAALAQPSWGNAVEAVIEAASSIPEEYDTMLAAQDAIKAARRPLSTAPRDRFENSLSNLSEALATLAALAKR